MDFVEGGVSTGNMGGASEQAETGDNAEADGEKLNRLPHLSDDSMEGAPGLAYQLPGYHGDEAELELAL